MDRFLSRATNMKHLPRSIPFALACASLLGSAPDAFARPQTTTPLVLGPNGTALDFGTLASSSPSFSADGRLVVFASYSNHVVPGLTNLFTGPQIFLLDTVTGVTRLVSATATGVPCNSGCDDATISADGSTIAFASDATDLASQPTTSWRNIHVYDVATGTLSLASVAANGNLPDNDSHHPVLSGNGRQVVFTSRAGNLVLGDNNGIEDVFLRDLVLGSTEWISAPRFGGSTGQSFGGSISADGRFVAFLSDASTLVPNDPPFTSDIFLLDRAIGTLRVASTTPSGTRSTGFPQLPRLSLDGQWLVFQSDATDLVPGDTNGAVDVFAHSITGQVTFRISQTPQGAAPAGASDYGFPSADGRFIAYRSAASDIVAGDVNAKADVFLYDMLSGRTELVSVSTTGVQGNQSCDFPQLDPTGRKVMFQTRSTTLAGPVTPNTSNLLVRDRGCVVTRYCSASPSSAGCSAAILGSGTPSATPGSSFHISTSDLPRERSAALVWGLAPTGLPYAGGLLCVQTPLHRTRASFTGGTGGPACGGTFDFDFSASYIGAQALAPGMSIFCQVLCRDAGGPNLALSDALNFVICP